MRVIAVLVYQETYEKDSYQPSSSHGQEKSLIGVWVLDRQQALKKSD